jgi:hypothetical protein
VRLRAEGTSGRDMGTGKGVCTRDIEFMTRGRKQTEKAASLIWLFQTKAFPRLEQVAGQSCDMSHISQDAVRSRLGLGTETGPTE